MKKLYWIPNTIVTPAHLQNCLENGFIYSWIGKHLTLSWRSFMIGPYHIETSSLICLENRWTGLHMICQRCNQSRVCSSDKVTPIYFLRLFKVWSILHHGSVGLVHKKMLRNTFICFFGIFLFAFPRKICVFIIFISFLMKYQVSATEY